MFLLSAAIVRSRLDWMLTVLVLSQRQVFLPELMSHALLLIRNAEKAWFTDCSKNRYLVMERNPNQTLLKIC